MFSILKPYIFSLDPESAHDLAIKSLKANFLPETLFTVKEEELLETNLFKKKIKNPIGLAAGFDKSAEVYNSIFKLGFGFIEVGTITPKKQLGNPKPRVFRLEEDEALINRLGFNNHGSEIVAQRISENKPQGILGINIGPNRETKNKSEDFYICLSKLYSYGDYLTINISSPNTEGLRNFHEENSMIKLLEGLNLPKNISGMANPKSSTGRLDVFTRLIIDNTQEFETVPNGYKGPMYIEISPRTFSILVRTGTRLNQLRFGLGNYFISDKKMQELQLKYGLVRDNDSKFLSDKVQNGLPLSVDLKGEDGILGLSLIHI